MVAPITLNVRHIRGHTFSCEVDHDADTLGLKVVIWELQQIAIENQRLVYAGKELSDSTKLSSVGITDGAQIFLVESSDIAANDDAALAAAVAANDAANNNNNNNVNEVSVSAAVVPPAFAPESQLQDIQVTAAVMPQSGSFAVNMPAPNSNYELVSDDDASLERINAAIRLAKFVRIYCIFGFMLTILGTLECMWFGLIALMYLLGWIGTRKLNRCLLVFPMILTFLFGFGGITSLIYHAFADCHYIDEYNYGWLIWTFLFFICILHVMIFASMTKLCCRIRKLSCDEWANARAKIRRRGCCC